MPTSAARRESRETCPLLDPAKLARKLWKAFPPRAERDDDLATAGSADASPINPAGHVHIHVQLHPRAEGARPERGPY